MEQTRNLPLNVTQKMTVVSSKMISEQPLFSLFMVTSGFLSWTSISLFPSENNLDIVIEKNPLLN